MTCYAISATERSVRTGCEKWLRRGGDYTTAALVTDCPGCIDSEGWANREGRLGIGDPDALVHDEIAMHPPEAGAGTRFKRRNRNNNPKEKHSAFGNSSDSRQKWFDDVNRK